MTWLGEALIRGAAADGGRRLDPERGLILAQATPNPIHTRIVSGRAHRVVDSALYALTLLETGDAGAAAVVLGAVLELQDADPASPTHGLWPYWAEEPVASMVPPDFNWADFIGELLALILLRHRDRLHPALRARTEAALGHAARSIRRRDVDLDYTNIAAKGAFVVLAAARLLDDAGLRAYGVDRMRRLHERVARTRTFVEYDSPPYWHVTMKALTAIRQHVPEGVESEVAGLERLAWQHLLARWHPAIGRLGGPMARCYDTDLRASPGVLMILQAVDPDHWRFFDRDHPVPEHVDDAHDAVLDYRIDPDLRPLLSRPRPSGTVTETFGWNHFGEGELVPAMRAVRHPGDALVVPVVGTTWTDERVSLGSVNHGDTWLQRRGLLGLWAEHGDEPGRAPLRAVTAELVKDGCGLAAGVITTAQHEGDVLWAFGLTSPGGDGHPVIGAFADGEPVELQDLAVRFTVRGLPEGADVSFDGAALRVRTATVALDWTVSLALAAGDPVPAVLTRPDPDRLVLEIPWVRSAKPRPLALRDLGTVCAIGTLRLRTGPTHPDAAPVAVTRDADVVRATWGPLALAASARVATRFAHARAYAG